MTWATSVPILVFLSLSVLELGLMYATDVRQKHRLMPLPCGGGGIIKNNDHSQNWVCALVSAIQVLPVLVISLSTRIVW